jgi:cation transport protein ChaC
VRSRTARSMSLTAELVALCERPEADPGRDPRFTPMTPQDHDALADRLFAELDGPDLWLFAYGSLIWRPAFSFAEERRGTLHGWHRSFCLEIRRWRGTPEQPGLMMALERGGRCEGLVYRLDDSGHREQIRRLVEREIGFAEDIGMVRWATVRTALGPVRALVFWAGPSGPRIASKLPLEQVARVLARACGHGGSGAHYLHQTVLRLDEYGIRDRNLWRLQELVAEEIATLHRPRADCADPRSGL